MRRQKVIKSMGSRSWDKREKLTQHDRLAKYNNQLAIFKRL